jgi:hypothetical protein
MPGSGSDAPRGPTAGCEKRQTTGASQLSRNQKSRTVANSSKHSEAEAKNRTASAPRQDGESDQKSNDRKATAQAVVRHAR